MHCIVSFVMLFVVTGVSQRFRPQGQWDVSPALASTVTWDPRGHHQWDGFPTSPTPPSTFPPQPVHDEAYCAPSTEPKHRPFTTNVPYTKVLLTRPAGLAATLNNHRAMSLLWTSCSLVHLGHAGYETLNGLLACAHPSGCCALYTAGRPTPPRQRINLLRMNLFKAHQVQHAIVFFVFCHAWFGHWCPSTYPPPRASNKNHKEKRERNGSANPGRHTKSRRYLTGQKNGAMGTNTQPHTHTIRLSRPPLPEQKGGSMTWCTMVTWKPIQDRRPVPRRRHYLDQPARYTHGTIAPPSVILHFFWEARHPFRPKSPHW